ncbi:MAG: ABC transporter ATP-binding protein [Acidobacteria bacterium]|jgi:hypothetical protein|nr:ABC transporter ATP-binding protein [Acidobacteriota bacterium]
MNLTVKRGVVGVVMAGALLMGPVVGLAQAQAVQTSAPTAVAVQNAEEVREEFRSVLRQYPPALGRVLLLDPTLLLSQAYLEPYPALRQFLGAHPEVARDPVYFLGHLSQSAWAEERNPGDILRREALNTWRGMFNDVIVFAGFILFAFTFSWIVKYIVDHRRWLRTTKTQSEVHGKLLERMTASEDLKSYMESEAGQRFLQASPLALETSNQQSVGAPFSRILWSVQVGVVMVALGIGFMFVRRGLEPEVQQLIGAWGTLAIALGIGFAISAAASYVISSKLGLLDQKR